MNKLQKQIDKLEDVLVEVSKMLVELKKENREEVEPRIGERFIFFDIALNGDVRDIERGLLQYINYENDRPFIKRGNSGGHQYIMECAIFDENKMSQ